MAKDFQMRGCNSQCSKAGSLRWANTFGLITAQPFASSLAWNYFFTYLYAHKECVRVPLCYQVIIERGDYDCYCTNKWICSSSF